jgi:hypothetical protein
MIVITDGLKEEIAVSNFFSKLGYFTRFHIQLYPKDGKISDIDVFCLKFDNHLMPTRNIIETKRNNDSSSAIFQLYGLKNFYENCNAFFVINNVSSRTIGITDRLNIKVYSFKRLRDLSKKDLKYPSIDFDEQQGQLILSNLSSIKKDIDEFLFWEYHSLWLEKDPYTKFNKIQYIFKITDDFYNKYPKSEPLKWFRKELFIMAFVSLIEISSNCIELDNKQINGFIENKFFNLGLPKEKKIKLQEGVSTLLNIIKEKTKQEIDFKLEILPDWLPLLCKLIKIIIANSPYANNYLLTNEKTFRSSINGNPKNVREFATHVLITKILPSINSDLLKILHKTYIQPDFENFV